MIAPDLWAVGAPLAPETGRSNAPTIATPATKLPIRDVLLIRLPPCVGIPACRATLARAFRPIRGRLEIPTSEPQAGDAEHCREVDEGPEGEAHPGPLGPAEGSQVDRLPGQAGRVRGEGVETALVEGLEGERPGRHLRDLG